MKPKGVFKVYFSLTGDLLDRVYRWQNPGDYKEEDNHIFSDKLEYKSIGGSHVYFESLTSGRKYQMFVSDFHKVMINKKIQDLIIEGEFTFTKKGVVQGFKMILPKTP